MKIQTSCRGAEGLFTALLDISLISYNSMKIQNSCRGAEGPFTALIDISYEDQTIVWKSKPLDNMSVLKYLGGQIIE